MKTESNARAESGEKVGSDGRIEPSEERSTAETTVEVRCTGHVRDAVGSPGLTFTFEGTTLREFLTAFFAEYDVEDMLIAETEADATTRGWATVPGELPGTWRKNPEGEQTRAYARVAINGTFNEHIGGLNTRLEDGDRVALMYPFIYCC
ncbi:MoaD/ThiS family protein [Haladaptatus sp. W1]|uniref:MoaD/ThiS family protein n=1 Tax=Haladaptatus sp. W1 TaxID=1897478 RepID=UPI0009F49FD3|nr:MoaD/ThiS family protein [Haladaptatus sp. W1]